MGASPSPIPVPVWMVACASALQSQNLTGSFVDQYGHPMSAFNNDTWGVTQTACYEVCGTDKMYQAFNFSTFSAAFTNWLLPWLALIAQLPYEASGPATNIMSAMLAIGSPALITFSLSLTVLNRYWIRQAFAGLKRDGRVLEWAPHVRERISAAGDLLQDAQQAPIRVSQEDGWLSSLIVLRENQPFWKTVKKDLNNTRRQFSASVFAQILMASVAYLFTIINAFQDGKGDDTVGLQIASGSLWVWMIPVIVGWIRVGTQWRAGAIDDALTNDNHKTYIASSKTNGDSSVGRRVGQQGITTVNYGRLRGPTWLGCNVAGDELEEGPVYNYSRIFTWFQCALHIAGGFSAMNLHLRAIKSQGVVDGEHSPDGSTTVPGRDPFSGTPSEIADYCDLPLDRTLDTYTSWSRVNRRVWQHIIVASAVALFMQWGTTGPAILIAYLTPLKGLACHSGSYVLYGSAATSAWFLLTISCFLSHAAMLRDQTTRKVDQLESTRTIGHSVLCGFAVCTRYLGKTIAVVNAGWLVSFALLEYIGVLQTCWCEANILSMGSRGWAPVFQDALNLTPASNLTFWGGGLAFSLLVCAVGMTFFWLASGGAELDDV